MLLLLLVAELLVLGGMARSPFAPWMLLAWPAGVWVTGVTVVCIWDQLTTPKARKPTKVR